MWWEYWGWRTRHGGPRPTKFVPSYYLNPKSWEHVKQIRKRAKQTKKNVKQIRKDVKCVVSHRPLWTCASTVTNTSIDRYEHVHRPLRDDFLNTFARIYHYFHRIIRLISSNYTIVFRTLCPCLQWNRKEDNQWYAEHTEKRRFKAYTASNRQE